VANETIRYLRRLQGALAPVTPGTVLLPEEDADLKARAVPGSTFEIALGVTNYQRVHAVAVPALDPLVSSSGTTWYPEADFSPEFSLVAPDESMKFLVRVSVPEALPGGTYVGALSLLGLRQQVFRLSVEVENANVSASTSRPIVRALNPGQPARKVEAKGRRVAKTKTRKLPKAKKP